MEYLKRYKIAAIVIGIAIIAFVAIAASNSPQPAAVSSYQNQQQAQPSQNLQQPSDNLSNDNYYINSYGNRVHSPAYSNTVPIGATAQCADGTYSFSQHRQGTCSHHGGVSEWLY